MTFTSAKTVDENITFLTQHSAESLFNQQRKFLEGKTTGEVNPLANEIRMLMIRAEVFFLSSLDGISAAKVMNFNIFDAITTDGLLIINFTNL